MEIIFIISFFTAFVVLLISKVGLRDYIVIHSRFKLISKLFNCDFCLCFWISLLVSVLIFLYTGNPIDLSFCIFSTPVARFLL